jgi:hypothetical protein
MNTLYLNNCPHSGQSSGTLPVTFMAMIMIAGISANTSSLPRLLNFDQEPFSTASGYSSAVPQISSFKSALEIQNAAPRQEERRIGTLESPGLSHFNTIIQLPPT